MSGACQLISREIRRNSVGLRGSSGFLKGFQEVPCFKESQKFQRITGGFRVNRGFQMYFSVEGGFRYDVGSPESL